MLTDELERRLRERLDALGPAPRAELLHVLILPDFERADRIGEFWGYPQSREFADLLIDCEEDRTLRAASKRMGDDSAMRARWSDAWILAAIDWAADADPAKIIAAADAINHAIPTIEEVEHAIQFLGAAGLVRYSDTSLRLTEEGRRVCRRTETKDIFTTLDRLHALLKTLPEVDEASNAESVLDRSTYLSALQRYETDIAKELPELYGQGTSSANRDGDDGPTA
jgi:hypothetical protein